MEKMIQELCLLLMYLTGGRKIRARIPDRRF